MPTDPCATTFIETQFPVARLSAEAYKERKAVAGQTLTGLGKWWGRKPLVMVRATLLGLLLPTTDDLRQDMEVFLRLMTMDEEGLWRRKDKSIPGAELLRELRRLPPSIQRRYLDPAAEADTPSLGRLTRAGRQELQRLVFEHLPYSEKLRYCRRPEQIDGPSPQAWAVINAHLGTHASSLMELVQELGERRYGRRPRVGDAFCGGGSVPFEAARLGCDAYGSDLNPVAALLTWAALHIVGGGEDVARQVQQAQEQVFQAVDAQVTAWGIEHNEYGWRADAYLYCTEAKCPECGWRVPLAPNWVIAEKTDVVAELLPHEADQRYDIAIHEEVPAARLKRARAVGTVRDSRLHCPHCDQSSPMEVVRRGLRPWENDDLVPRPDDVFQERLYCIRWVETYYERRDGRRVVETLTDHEAQALDEFEAMLAQGTLKEGTRRRYCAPTAADDAREARVLALLEERFHAWQAAGYLPSRRIEPGDETSRLQRERGWTHWHHLFLPRNLLYLGSVMQVSSGSGEVASILVQSAMMLYVGKLAERHARIMGWDPTVSGGLGATSHVFTNQALNTSWTMASKAFWSLRSIPFARCDQISSAETEVRPLEATQARWCAEYWLTDPPYADAVNYHELSEFFLAWYEKHLPRLFPDWYTDSKRALAIRGDDPVSFRQSMVAAYRNLATHMPDDGLQVVMFTHQDAAVWADLTMILWAAGLRVTAAWTIATETDSALKAGNYVQGTVLLVCRKRMESDTLFLDELVPRIELEVRQQLNAMLALDDESDPNFGDADYQLAAYAAALRVLTAQPIEDIDPLREIGRVRPAGEESPIERLIRSAVRIACDHLVPRGLDAYLWRTLSPMERLYLKGLEVESHGEYRSGVYQELARGFGATAYTDLLADTTANQTRLRTPGEFGRRMLGGEGYAGTLLRHVLFAVHQAESPGEPRSGLNYLKTELPDYWGSRDKIIHLLDYMAVLRRVSGMEHWHAPADSAGMLAALVRNDSI
jgi:adenine-specific DNA methylase